MKRPDFLVPCLVAVVALCVSACGGGGGGGGATPVSVPVVTTATATPTPVALVTQSPVPVATASVAVLATPGPTIAAMASIGTNIFASAIAPAFANGIVSNASGAIVTTTSASAPALTSEPISVKAGTSATVFDRARTPLGISAALALAADAPVERPARGAVAAPFFAVPHKIPERANVNARASEVERVVQHATRDTNRDVQGIRRAQSLPVVVGATSSFYVDTGSSGNVGSSQTLVPATLGAVSTHGYVWLDNTLALPAQSIAAIATDFENAYVSDTTHFGSPEYTSAAPGALLTTTPCDATGAPLTASSPVPVFIPPPNGKHVVLVLNEATFGANVGGYFSALNLFVQAVANCVAGHPKSNETSMIVVGYDATNTAQFELQEDLVRGTAHEFQHEINYISHTILGQVPFSERSWIDEGLSMLAQDFAVHAMFPAVSNDLDDALGRAYEFLTSPSKFSLTGFTGIAAGDTTFSYNCSGCYGVSYLFQRYLYDRFGGDTYTRAMETSTASGATGLARVTGVSPATLISDFALALLVNRTGLTQDARFTFSLNPYGTFTDQFGRSGSLAGPGVFSLSPGATRTVTAYAGTFHYVQIQTTAGQGAGITVSDPAGTFGLTASLVQF